MAPTAAEAKITSSPASVLVMMDEQGAELVIDSCGNHEKVGSAGPRTQTKAHEQSTGCTPSLLALTTRTPSSAFDLGICAAIDTLLSNPIKLGPVFTDDWQWSYLGMVRNGRGSTVEEVKEARKVLRNRAFSIKLRRRRLENVRRDLSPFTMSPARPKRSSWKLEKVRSFDVENRSAGSSARNRTNNRETTNRDTNILSLVSMCGCNPHKPDSPAIIRSRMLDAVHEDACYDSDPEDFTRQMSLRRKDSQGNKENNDLSNTNRPITQFRNMDSEDYVYSLQQEFLNERFTLILHTSTKGSEAKPCTPHAVKAWFERGQHLSNWNGAIQPKFMWHKVDRRRSKRRVGLPTVQQVCCGFELVDVARVLSVDHIDRCLYPFAKPASCFLIKTLDTAYLFEAKTKSERERIVRWLKVTVSRLASKLIVGDHSLFDEFFITGMPDGGPGEAPAFLGA